MPNWEKLAKGRTGGKDETSEQEVPEKTLEESCREEIDEVERAIRQDAEYTHKRLKRAFYEGFADGLNGGKVSKEEQAFRDRLDREDARKRAATDSEFWFAVVFANRGEKAEFLRKYGLDKVGDKYLSGLACDKVLQRRIGIKDAHKRRI